MPGKGDCEKIKVANRFSVESWQTFCHHFQKFMSENIGTKLGLIV